MSSEQTMVNVSCCEVCVTGQSNGPDRNIPHNPRYPTLGMADLNLTIDMSKRQRGRSCIKSKNGNYKRHRSASLSPALRRRSSDQELESHMRKRSKSVPPQRAQEGGNTSNEVAVEYKESEWTEVPVFVYMGTVYHSFV